MWPNDDVVLHFETGDLRVNGRIVSPLPAGRAYGNAEALALAMKAERLGRRLTSVEAVETLVSIDVLRRPGE